ncbi:hypothetical protein AcV5_000351 [Taiwanofungus camphoratus]|nr:hypothetical protein AcV5_000351 [Antrodia cinnamomea]
MYTSSLSQYRITILFVTTSILAKGPILCMVLVLKVSGNCNMSINDWFVQSCVVECWSSQRSTLNDPCQACQRTCSNVPCNLPLIIIVMTSATARPLSFSGPRPLKLVDGNVQSVTSPSTSSCPSPTISGLSTPPPSASTFKPRRQSSISYYSSDNAPYWDLRSPTSASSPSLKRCSSLGQNTRGAPVKGDRRSIGSVEVQSPVVDRGPLTLTERHADLLHFIAQKESKCLELRSQLATHEAELAQLKRKWERIVSRGMDRASSVSPSSPDIGSVDSPATNGAVLEGIKESVQGVGRLLATGLADLSSPSSSAPTQVLPGFAPVSRASATATIRRSRGHASTQSTSSVSTYGTSTSSSVRLSQSSASSLALDESLPGLDEKDERAEEREGRERHSMDNAVEISPATALRAAKLYRRKSRDYPASLALSSSPTTPGSPSPLNSEPPIPSALNARTSKRSSMNLSSGLPPAASIPGLSPLAVQPVSSWMESVGQSVGRKWEEIQKGETFTKSQKRASLLLSDVSQSFFSALASPTASGTSVSISSNPFAATLSPLSSSPSGLSPMGQASSSPASLLEDDDVTDCLGSVMIPDSKVPAVEPTGSNPAVRKKQTQSDDEWNW